MLGQVFGHFRVVERIGSGGMGVVYLAHDQHLDRSVALKVLPTVVPVEATPRRRFRQEAMALSRLNHPNIAVVHDFDTFGDVDVLVMEYVPGTTLSERVHAGPLTETEVLDVGVQLLSGLEAAHAHGIVHRDLKPGNLRLTPTVISKFSILASLDSSKATRRRRLKPKPISRVRQERWPTWRPSC